MTTATTAVVAIPIPPAAHPPVSLPPPPLAAAPTAVASSPLKKKTKEDIKIDTAPSPPAPPSALTTTTTTMAAIVPVGESIALTSGQFMRDYRGGLILIQHDPTIRCTRWFHLSGSDVPFNKVLRKITAEQVDLWVNEYEREVRRTSRSTSSLRDVDRDDEAEGGDATKGGEGGGGGGDDEEEEAAEFVTTEESRAMDSRIERDRDGGLFGCCIASKKERKINRALRGVRMHDGLTKGASSSAAMRRAKGKKGCCKCTPGRKRNVCIFVLLAAVIACVVALIVYSRTK